MREVNRAAIETAIRKMIVISARAVMRVDHEFTHPGATQMLKSEADERALINRNERFWQKFGERLKTCSETCSEDEGFVHAPNLGAPPILFNENSQFELLDVT